MDRRRFLKIGGVGVVGVAVGATAGETRGRLLEEERGTRRRERATFAGVGGGSASVVWSVDTDEAAVALTFDDGPHPTLTPKVLDVLAHHEVQATFFFIGSAAERHRDLVKRTIDEGHEVGNHTWSHPLMANLDHDEARNEVVRGSEALTTLTGHAPRWFRPPRGMLSGSILRAAADLDQGVVMWSATAPYASATVSTRQITDHLLSGLQPGAIYCLHDGTSGRDHDAPLGERRQREIAALPAFVVAAIERGSAFRTLSDLVGGPSTT